MKRDIIIFSKYYSKLHAIGKCLSHYFIYYEVRTAKVYTIFNEMKLKSRNLGNL